MSFGTKFIGAAVALCLAGCGNYYMVRDPSARTEYYTTDIDSAGMSGAVKFKDVKTGSTVTLQSSEVKEISKDEFTKATAKPPAQ